MKFKSLKYYSILLLLIWICFQNNALARVINPDSLLLKVKEKLEVIKDYKADIVISLDVDFIKMPDKNAKMYFKYPDKVRFTSDEFFMLPKNGFGMSVQKILKNDYLAVYSGIEEIDNHPHYIIKIIPDSKRSDIALSTLWINPANALISKMENTTKNNGSYIISLDYNDSGVELPSAIKISFQVEKFKIPLNFIGKNTVVDKDKLKGEGLKQGNVYIKLTYYDINKGIEDSFFDEENNPDE